MRHDSIQPQPGNPGQPPRDPRLTVSCQAARRPAPRSPGPRRLGRLARLAAAAMLAVLPLLAIAAPPVAALVEGTDYIEIADGKAFAPQAGKIEVVEVFGYTCPHCAHFEPLLSAWKARLPADVDFVAVPAPFGGYWIPYAQAFYAAQAMGLVDRTHMAMFRALHETRSLPITGATPAEIAGFYAGHGADPAKFAEAMASPETRAKLDKAREFLLRSGVEGTPALVVDGRYRVLGNSAQDMLRITDALVQRERAARQAAARDARPPAVAR